MTPQLRQSPDAIIGAEYEDFKDEVVRSAAGKLASSKIHFSDLDMDGFYNQAWYGLYTKLQDGESIDNRKGLLVQMTYRRAIDEYRTLHPDRQADPVVLETVGVENPIEETLDQQRQFREFVEGMRSGLNQRELQAATLCYVYGLSRPEAAEQVGVRPKRMEKIMDEVSRKLRPMLATIKEGEWCEDRAVLINQFALGALEPDSDEYREAAAHLEHCSGCRRHVLGTRGLTAVTIPSALMLLALTSGAAAVAGGTAVAAGAGGGGSAAGAGGAGAGASAGAGAGAGVGVAQVAAIVATVAAVAAGGAVVSGKVGGGGDNGSSSGTSSQSAASAGAASSPAVSGKPAKKKAEKKKAKRKAKKKAKAASATASAPAPVAETPAQTAPQQTTPAPSAPSDQSSESASEEFDLR